MANQHLCHKSHVQNIDVKFTIISTTLIGWSLIPNQFDIKFPTLYPWLCSSLFQAKEIALLICTSTLFACMHGPPS
jgi:hypothetical protein